MFQLVYVSSANHLLTEPELLDLLAVASYNNRRRGVTGLLCHHDGSYIQLLEGDRVNVEAVYAKILRDPRHSCFMRLLESEADARLFPDWRMGFRNLSDKSIKDMPGFSTFMLEPPPPESARSKRPPPMVLLDTFRSLR